MSMIYKTDQKSGTILPIYSNGNSVMMRVDNEDVDITNLIQT